MFPLGSLRVPIKNCGARELLLQLMSVILCCVACRVLSQLSVYQSPVFTSVLKIVPRLIKHTHCITFLLMQCLQTDPLYIRCEHNVVFIISSTVSSQTPFLFSLKQTHFSLWDAHKPTENYKTRTHIPEKKSKSFSILFKTVCRTPLWHRRYCKMITE